MRIIINADDFGINKRVTGAIIDCIDKRLISSTTIMANGECLSEVKEYSSFHPDISFGIHYCLSEFSSITKCPTFVKYNLTNSDGFFIKKAIFKLLSIDRELRDALYRELCAQTECLLNMGFQISHADSHHHVHTLPFLQDIFVEVLKKYNIRKVRIPPKRRLLSIVRHPMLYRIQRKVFHEYKSQFITTDNFCSYMEYIQSPHKYDTVELMCHPGHPGNKYQDEMKLLYQSNLSEELISYNEL